MARQGTGDASSGDFWSFLGNLFGDCSGARSGPRGDFKKSAKPELFDLPAGKKGKPVIQEVVEVDSMFKTMPKVVEGGGALRSSYHAITSQSELQKARETSGKIYEKEEKVAKQHAEEFLNNFGSEAMELVEEIFQKHKVTDPMKVDQDAEPEEWEERWELDKDSRDVEGEAKVKQLGEIIRGVNRERAISGADPILFTDPHFPPELSSIYADPATAGANANASSTVRTDQDAFLTGVDPRSIQWKRPREFGNPDETPVVYSGGIDPNDVAQGKLGNCYFMAAIASCCIGDEDFLVKDLCVEECGDVGMYAVKFFINGKWRSVLIDDLIPCTEDANGTWMPLFASPKQHDDQVGNEKELWSLIFEKAWAKLHMSYEVTDAGMTGDTTSYLTGGTVKTVTLEQNVQESDDLRQWEELVKLSMQANSLAYLSAGIRPGVMDGDTLLNSYGLMDGHAYSILDLRNTSIGERLVHVRNPWGHTEWKGRWSDHAQDWTPQLKKEMGHEAQQDGAFWMCWEDFIYFFGYLEVCDPAAICRLTEDGGARVDVLKSYWIKGKTAGGGERSMAFDCNPGAILKVRKTGPVEIALYQPDTRPTMTVSAIHNIPMELYLIDKTTNKPKQKIIETSSRMGCYFMHQAVANHEYHLVAAACNPGVESAFWITASGSGCTLTAIPRKQPTAQQAGLMSCDNARQMCCVVCRQEDPDGSYYDTKEGLKCEACKSKPVKLGTVPKSSGSSQPAAQPAAEPAAPAAVGCEYCRKAIDGGSSQKIQGKTYCFPPCWQAPPACYYCREQIKTTYSKTQYGPLCNPCGRKFGVI